MLQSNCGLSAPCPTATDALLAGMLLSNQFPVNYFSISEVEQSFPDFEARRRQQSAHPESSRLPDRELIYCAYANATL